MRQFVIDELSPMERDNIDSYLKRTIKQGPMIGIYWIELPPDLLSEAQLVARVRTAAGDPPKRGRRPVTGAA